MCGLFVFVGLKIEKYLAELFECLRTRFLEKLCKREVAGLRREGAGGSPVH